LFAASAPIDPLFRVANYVEAVLWIVIGAAFAAVAVFRRGARRSRAVQAAAAFALFGLSDVVEAGTGAWWRPWWLLAWKGACVLVLGALLLGHWRRARRRG